jgi:hypothetical protein
MAAGFYSDCHRVAIFVTEILPAVFSCFNKPDTLPMFLKKHKQDSKCTLGYL